MRKLLLAMLLVAWVTFQSVSVALESFAETQAKAEQGDAQAQCYLGDIYLMGGGVSKDAKLAVKWYRKAAEQGNAEGQVKLASLYEMGHGVTKDDVKAVEWVRKAAEQGYTPAQYSLGSRYAEGKGVSKDDVESVKWYRRAAEQGAPYAQFALGISYERGEGVPVNGVEALKWFLIAQRLEAVAMYKADLEKVLAPEQIAAAQKLSVEWKPKSASQQLAMEQYNIAVRYAEGKGMPKDAVEACKWFHLASAQGSEEAAPYRVLLEKTMTPEQIAEAQKQAKEWKPAK